MSIRRRLMMQVGKSSPYDAMGYIKAGKIFHVDGINKGGDETAWIDLVNGKRFPLVTGVTFDTDHVIFASGHGELKTTSAIRIPKDKGTIEAVFTYPTSRQSIFYSGASGTMSLMMFNGNNFLMATGSGSREQVTIPNSAKKIGKVSQYSVFVNSGKCNGEDMSTGSSTYWSVGKKYAIIGTSLDGSSYNFVGNLYCIRAYNRHLTNEERAHNLEVDNERFNLGLNI